MTRSTVARFTRFTPFTRLALVLAFLLSAAMPAPTAAAPTDAARLDALVRKYFDGHYAFEPSLATFMGVHTYDRELENTTRARVDKEAASIRATLRELDAIPRAKLDVSGQVDYDLFRNTIQGHLYRLTELRPWETDPGAYGLGWALENLIARDFAPAPERLRSVIARLRLLPRQFVNARANLKNPPRLLAEFAAEDLEGSLSYLDNDVPRAFSTVTDSALWREYEAAKKHAQDEMKKQAAWIRTTLVPKSTGSYVLGEERYRKRLLYEEMIDQPIDSLLAIGSRELARLQARYQDCAQRIAPGAPMDSVKAMMRRDHPTRDGLLDEVRALLGDLRAYCTSSSFIRLPSEAPLSVRATPEYAASRSFASFDGPGPLETKARDSYYNITLPGATWDAARVEEHLQAYSRWTLPSVSIHEVYPGHYVHFLYGPQTPTFARMSMGSGSFGEGWGLYTEEALFDHGYAKGDAKKEFGMLRWALVRSCRLQVGLRVHTRGMSMDEAKQFFVENAGMEPANAEREAFRAAFDPLYIVYTVGALQIRKLRDDVRVKEGTSFDLASFHARILSQGALPVKLLRRLLLNDDGPTL
jgi:uncharacterized protein (DUF885 family)